MNNLSSIITYVYIINILPPTPDDFPLRDAPHPQKCTSKGVGRQGVSSCCKEFLCFNTMSSGIFQRHVTFVISGVLDVAPIVTLAPGGLVVLARHGRAAGAVGSRHVGALRAASHYAILITLYYYASNNNTDNNNNHNTHNNITNLPP